MGTTAARRIALSLVMAVLATPAGLAAKERRGAMVLVTRLDGTQAGGELIAVKPDSLLLLSGGRDLSIGLADVRSVRIIRQSRSGLLAGIGAAAGFVGAGGFVLTVSQEDVVKDKVKAALAFGLLAGGAFALTGSLVGKAMGWDTEYAIAGTPEDTLARNWHKLRAQSREGALPGTAPPDRPRAGPPPRAEDSRPAAPPADAGRRTRPLRFGLSVSTSVPARRYDSFSRHGSFRFPEEAVPESGPYPLALSGRGDSTRRRTWGPIQAVYHWSDRWAAELGLLFLGSRQAGVGGPMTFQSGLDGLTYQADFGTSYRAHLVAVLAGVAYRLIVPSDFNRHSVEAAASAGPAFVFVQGEPRPGDVSSLSRSRKTAFCGEARAAYDFSITPELFVGAFAGYRRLRTTLSGSSQTQSYVFWATTGPALGMERPTEVSVPGIPLDASGPFWGFRAGVRF